MFEKKKEPEDDKHKKMLMDKNTIYAIGIVAILLAVFCVALIGMLSFEQQKTTWASQRICADKYQDAAKSGVIICSGNACEVNCVVKG